MLWVKAFHVVFMVTWFAGLFYLPRLYVYHSMADDALSVERFAMMERKLFWGIMTPGGAATVLLGAWMLFSNASYYAHARWMHFKLVTVALVLLYHIWCGKLLLDFSKGRNVHGHVWYRWFNEVPVVFLTVIVVLTIVRPL